MNKKTFYALMTATGLSFMVILISFAGNEPEETSNPDVSVEIPPFETYISGSGVVEPASGNIAVSAPSNRVIEKVNVAVNNHVKKNDILFQLYNKDLKAALNIKQKQYEEQQSYLQSLEMQPREQDLTIAQENLNKADAAFDEASVNYYTTYYHSKSNDEKRIAYDKYLQAQSDLAIAQAQYDKVKIGTWCPDLKIAQDRVEQAKAAIAASRVEIDQTYVKAPMDGTILQIKIHEGELVDPSKPAMILGNIDRLHLRVSIDQFNQSRFEPECSAVAFKQNNATREFPLEFILVEPLMIPKKYLTNDLQEKVDTQTFEVLYHIDNQQSRLFIGELMDVYIYVLDSSPSAHK